MKHHIAATVFAAVALASMAAGMAGAQTNVLDEVVNANGVAPKLELTPAQKNMIYHAIHKDSGKTAPSRFATNVGAAVPPMIELYTLPDDILASNPVTKLYQFVRVDDQIVLVDPVNMRVVDVIGPGRRD